MGSGGKVSITYFNAEIVSEVALRAVRIGGTRRYRFEIASWRSWVVDNYDWNSEPYVFGKNGALIDVRKAIEYDRQGRKRYGGVLGGALKIPSNAEMRSLERLISAAAYTRSSTAWAVNPSGISWEYEFSTDSLTELVARSRATIESRHRLQRAEEALRGALPVPEPHQPSSR
jgi:hypothetical protein